MQLVFQKSLQCVFKGLMMELEVALDESHQKSFRLLEVASFPKTQSGKRQRMTKPQSQMKGCSREGERSLLKLFQRSYPQSRLNASASEFLPRLHSRCNFGRISSREASCRAKCDKGFRTFTARFSPPSQSSTGESTLH